MAGFVVAFPHSPPLFFLSLRLESGETLAKSPLQARRSLLRVDRRIRKRLVSASAISSPDNFPSVAFPVRIFNRPPNFSGSAMTIGLFVSAVFAALVCVLKLRRKRCIAKRKIISFGDCAVHLRSEDVAVSGESLLGVSEARVGFSGEGMYGEEISRVRDAIGGPRRDSVISSLIDPSNALGWGLEPQGLGFRSSFMYSSPVRKTSRSEIGEAGPATVSRGADTHGIGNVMNVRGQLFDDLRKEGKRTFAIDKGFIDFHNGESEIFSDDIQMAGNDNVSEIHRPSINDGTEGSEVANKNTSEIVSRDSKLLVDGNADEIQKQLINEGTEGSNVVTEASKELLTPLHEGSQVVSGNVEINGDDLIKDIHGRVIDDEREEGNRRLTDDERENRGEFTKNYHESTDFLYEESKLAIGDLKTEGDVFGIQNRHQLMQGGTEQTDKVSEPSSEFTGYHNEEDKYESLTVPDDSIMNSMPVASVNLEFGLENPIIQEQEEMSSEAALKRAMPAIAMGAGLFAMLTTGGHGCLEMVGFVAATSFIAYNLLWASNRKRWWSDIMKVSDREELMNVLRSRNIINDV